MTLHRGDSFGILFISSCSDFLAAARRLSQCKWLCLVLDGFMLLILSANPSTALTVLLNSSEIYRFAERYLIFAFYLTNPSPIFSLDNYSLFLRGDGRKGFALESWLASTTQKKKDSATHGKKAQKKYILSSGRNKKHAHYQFLNIHRLGKVTHFHHHWNHQREEGAISEHKLHVNAINHQYLRLGKSTVGLS